MDFAVKENELGSPYMAFFPFKYLWSTSAPAAANSQGDTCVCPSPERHQGWKDETDSHQLLTFSREALNYDLMTDACTNGYFSSIWFSPRYLELILAGSKRTVKNTLCYFSFMPQRIEKKNKCYKNNVINVCSEECSRTSAEAQDWNQSLALSQITPQNWSASLWIILRRKKKQQ